MKNVLQLCSASIRVLLADLHLLTFCSVKFHQAEDFHLHFINQLMICHRLKIIQWKTVHISSLKENLFTSSALVLTFLKLKKNGLMKTKLCLPTKAILIQAIQYLSLNIFRIKAFYRLSVQYPLHFQQWNTSNQG